MIALTWESNIQGLQEVVLEIQQLLKKYIRCFTFSLKELGQLKG